MNIPCREGGRIVRQSSLLTIQLPNIQKLTHNEHKYVVKMFSEPGCPFCEWLDTSEFRFYVTFVCPVFRLPLCPSCGTIYVRITVLSHRNKPLYTETPERMYGGSRFAGFTLVFATAVPLIGQNTVRWWQFFSRVIHFCYHCTANRTKDCTVVALRRGSSVLIIVVHPDDAR